MKYIKYFERIEATLSYAYLKLTKLPKLSKNLKKLYCSGNFLSELPELPSELIELQCMANKLTELPELPSGLIELYCVGNKLTKLPKLPKTLEKLACYDNNLTELPILPEGLEYLSFDFHTLTNKLIILPESLISIYCPDKDIPFTNLEEYRVWFAKTYPEIIDAEKFNI